MHTFKISFWESLKGGQTTLTDQVIDQATDQDEVLLESHASGGSFV